MYTFSEGYHLISVMPKAEATISRDLAVRTSVYMEAGVLAMLFVLILVLMKWLVVDNIHKVNHALAKITEGNLDVCVDVHANEEFSLLSKDINSTVDTLKRYIAEPPCPLESTEKLEQLRALWMGAKIAVVETSDEGVGVDTPEDAVRVGKLLEARNA